MTAITVPPQSLEAERSVLGAMLVSESAVSPVIDDVKLKAEDFYLDRHRTIFACLYELYGKSGPTDELSVIEALKSSGQLEKAGDRHYVSELAAGVAAVGNAAHHARIVQENAGFRGLLRVVQRGQEAVERRNGESPAALHRRLEELLAESRPVEATAPEIDRWSDGAAFILDAPDHVPAIWGEGDDVLHAAGEPLLIAAPPGVGKTTLAGQLALATAGVGPDHLLGFPVRASAGKVVYVAADRPAQAARSFRRMVGDGDREELVALEVWRGPLPFNLAAEPHRLVPFLKARDASAAFIDSLGATAFDLASDEAGSRVFAALSEATAEGIEVVVLHHDRKREQGADRVRTLDDVYGSRWITSAAGSVLYLDGRAGDLIVKLRHLKQPAGEVGPLTIRHDHVAGRTVIHEPADLVELAATGLTVKQAAALLFELSDPSPNEVEKTRRRLDKLADRGDLERISDSGEPTVYRRAP